MYLPESKIYWKHLDEPETITIEFEKGDPIKLDG